MLGGSELFDMNRGLNSETPVRPGPFQSHRRNQDLPDLGIIKIDRSYALEIREPVTPGKAGVQKSQCERIRTIINDFGYWIPAFAGMTVLTV